jgi:hypothetical protein
MWRKSSKSEAASQCVEVRHDLAALRDSKNPGVVVSVERGAMTRLTVFARGR